MAGITLRATTKAMQIPTVWPTLPKSSSGGFEVVVDVLTVAGVDMLPSTQTWVDSSKVASPYT